MLVQVNQVLLRGLYMRQRNIDCLCSTMHLPCLSKKCRMLASHSPKIIQKCWFVVKDAINIHSKAKPTRNKVSFNQEMILSEYKGNCSYPIICQHSFKAVILWSIGLSLTTLFDRVLFPATHCACQSPLCNNRRTLQHLSHFVTTFVSLCNTCSTL